MSRLATEAELRALRAQINPHFLFNALTTIGYLIQTAPARAVQTLLRLTDLLRRVLKSGGEMMSLGVELDLVSAYLDIERARFEERLQVVIDVPETLREAIVPAFVLQPLVENAVRHGIAASRAGGTVTISARLESSGGPAPAARPDSEEPHEAPDVPAATELLHLIVQDTGAGAGGSQHGMSGEGIGLANVERRLALAYGSRAQLRFHSEPARGTRVDLLIPIEQRSWPVSRRADRVSAAETSR
jgi:LytS/YehU family sensor histidine kinase